METGQDPAGGAPSIGTSMTFDEMENALKTSKPAPTDLNKTLEGEGIPDDLKGKPIKDVIAEIAARKEREATAAVAEEAARRAIAAAQPAPTAAAQPAHQPEPEQKDLTEDELAKLYEEDPLKAIKVMNAQAEKRVMKNMEGRMAPMAGGFAQLAEQEARKKYASEFALFEPEIQQLISQLPNKALLSNPKAWDDLVGLIRGRPGNFERLLEHHKVNVNGATARNEQALATGFHAPPRNSPPPTPVGQLTELEKAVAREMGLSEDEYIFWRQDTR